MKCVCTTGFNEKEQEYFLNQVPLQFGGFYNLLGPDRCKSLRYRKDLLTVEVDALVNIGKNGLKIDVYASFPIGLRISRQKIKQELGRLYERHNISKVSKATDIMDYFEVCECKVANPSDPKKRDKGFEIIKRKEI